MLVALLGASYLALQNSWVQTRITRHVAHILSEKLNTNITVGHVDIRFFKKLYLEDILIEDQSSDTLLYAELVTATIDTFKIKKHILQIDELSFSGNQLKVNRDTADNFNFNFIFQAIGNQSLDKNNHWFIACNSFLFKGMDIEYYDYYAQDKKRVFVDNLNLDVEGFRSVADSVSFRINRLVMNDGKSLELNKLNADVTIKAKEINILKGNLESRYSAIDNANVHLELPEQNDSVKTPLNIDFTLDKSKVSFRELGILLPGFKGMDQLVEFSGRVYGNINDLKGKNILLNTGQETSAIIDFYINEPRDPENMYLFIDLKESQTSFSDLANIRLPNTFKYDYLSFPEGFYEAGLLNFNGNFSGFLSDFVTFGTLRSQMGTLKTDILVTPEKSGNIYYRGNLSTQKFRLDELFNKNYLGELTFSGSVDGNYNTSSKHVSGIFKGDISRIDLLDYAYTDIKFDGILLDKMFDGLLSMNDPNLKFSFLGQIDFNHEIPDFDFMLEVDRALPGKLNLSETFPNAETAFDMNANFRGTKIDNIDGNIEIREGFYKNRNGEINLGGMTLNTSQQNHTDSLTFRSDFLDVDIEGDYHFRSLITTLAKTFNEFIPSYPIAINQAELGNTFSYKFSVKDINSLANIMLPGLRIDKPFLLYGVVNSEENNFELEGSIPGIRYNNFIGRDIFIGNKIIDDTYTSKFRFGEIHLAEDMNLYNFKIDSKIAENVIDNTISWSNYDEITYSGDIRTHTVFTNSASGKSTQINISGSESNLYIADTLWHITPFEISIDSNDILVSGLNIFNENQRLSLSGTARKSQTDLLRLQFRNINLQHLGTYFKTELDFSGIANGTIGFSNLFNEPMFLSDMTVSNLKYKDQILGDISLKSRWNSDKSQIDSELKVVSNNRTKLNANGSYQPSTSKLDFDATLDSVPLIVLESFIGKSFSDFQGYGSGKVNIGGTANDILLNGALMGGNAGLTVDVTQIPYSFSDSVYFINDTILFDNILVTDDRNNRGRFNGTIVHDNFQNMIFDLRMTSNKIRAMNTTLSDNDKFYGVAVVSGQLDITGKGNVVKLNGSVTSLQGTEINISMEAENEAEKYDFIQFVKPDATEESDFYKISSEPAGELSLSLAIEATPEAKVQLIYNSQIGDIIKAQGEGILIFEMNPEGDIFLSGNYQPTKGDYLFTLQNVINKRFTIQQGGSIVWSGDPYNADIDLSAVYKLKASLYDLLSDDYENLSQNQRVQVECIIHLKDELANPTISFDINLPNIEALVEDKVQQYINTEDELNKQILSLIVMGKFYTPEYKRGIYEAQNTNMFGTTASELFSNQLSNWLSQINENWDVGINYRPGNNVTDDEIELALSTQILNDRVTLNGNIGNNVNQYGTNSSQIVGDFEINVKLVPSGKLQFKAYNRSNNNLIYETAPYTQGIGLSVTEEYNTIGDLLKKLKNLFTGKKKDEESE
ncbi:translocation/assembly module TamB domain-containing protein [Maribellus mangrovi]|uniref:translocation/assembly module TamB domain-containing protein n=1 Tax=Maribellus mangrovi TaxID=3133146 RepID=UPI0030EC0C86